MFGNKHSLVRTIYLYLFALMGLTLVVVGTVRLVNLGLKTYVFTKADQQYYSVPQPRLTSTSNVEVETLVENCKNNEELSQEQRDFLLTWSQDYEEWQQKQNSGERLKSQRQERAANSLAWLIVGLPLFFYHWSIIRRETEAEESA